ncbi:MAG: ATP-binding protein [Desulfovibrionaceae bacterium]|nr:ATP-binding protein [Desulfovibrionaceae bacterium]
MDTQGLLREIVIISGKGGTGKSSLMCAFAALASDTVFCDLDVDVPDLHIIFKPKPSESTVFKGGNKAKILAKACAGCGQCQDLCQFKAISRQNGIYQVDEALCEGCGVCYTLCPNQAISFQEADCGEWQISSTRFGPLVHAALIPGQENSGRLVSLLKREARALAKRLGFSTLLCDGSPGIGCPVISSLAGASQALAVVEPSLSGLHDFKRVALVCEHFRLPVGVIINRYDLNPEGSLDLLKFCQEKGYEVLGQVPFADEMVRATQQGLAATELESSLADLLREIWAKVIAWKPTFKLKLATLT